MSKKARANGKCRVCGAKVGPRRWYCEDHDQGWKRAQNARGWKAGVRIMRSAGAACLLLALASTAQAQACGAERWDVKTMADPDAALVDTVPLRTTVDELRRLPRPEPIAHHRSPVEEQTFAIRAIITSWAHERDGDLHLVLTDPAHPDETMIGEIPAPNCAAPRIRAAVRQARATLIATLGRPSSAFRAVRLRVLVMGAAFFDFRHGQNGVAPNAIEIHPILQLEVVR